MSDLRLDPITGQWVAIASNRQLRPNEFRQILERQSTRPCPFCVGNESETPAPIQVVLHPDHQDQWIVRVVPNKYPSFPQDTAGRIAPGSLTPGDSTNGKMKAQGPYQQQPAGGVQEVIIHSGRHVESLRELDRLELLSGFRVFADRVRWVREQPHIEHAMLFKNCRAEAGASLQHIHSQLIGTPIVPDQLRSRWRRMQDHLKQTGETLLSSIVKWELAEECRALEVTDNFVVLCPFASRFSYQLWIIPKDRSIVFGATEAVSDELAGLCQRYVTRLDDHLNNPAYNILFHFAPREFAASEHWFVEIFPRLTHPAGFEWGTGWWVNPFAPEDVARALRCQA